MLKIKEPKIRLKTSFWPGWKLLRIKSPALKKNTNLVIAGLLVGARRNKKARHELENKPLSAGRGGKHYSKVSSIGHIAESGIKATRPKKKEHKPYKPLPYMHTLYSLEDLRRMGGR